MAAAWVCGEDPDLGPGPSQPPTNPTHGADTPTAMSAPQSSLRPVTSLRGEHATLRPRAGHI